VDVDVGVSRYPKQETCKIHFIDVCTCIHTQSRLNTVRVCAFVRTFHRHPLVRMELQHLLQQVQRQGRGCGREVGSEGAGRLLSPTRQNAVQGRLGRDEIEFLDGRDAHLAHDDFQLVLRVVAPEEGFMHEELGEDAAHGPDVDAFAVVDGFAEQFGGAVPPDEGRGKGRVVL
jgi:hypothetical protein